MKRITAILLLFMSGILMSMSQSSPKNYIVYSITGKPKKVLKSGKRSSLKLRDKLKGTTELIIPVDANIELIDSASQKRYSIKTTGRATVSKLIKKERNTTVQLSKRYFNYVMAELHGNKQTVTISVSDPATITRDSVVVTEDSSVIIREIKEE